MGRVSQDTIDKINAFLDMLPDEATSKCTLCTETLTHIVKQAEAQIGAGTATVTRMIAERHNETAAPLDRVTGTALQFRVRNNEGKTKIADRNNSGQPYERKETPCSYGSTERREKRYVFDNEAIVGTARYFLLIAIGNMDRIMLDDPGLIDALHEMIEWCENKLEKVNA